MTNYRFHYPLIIMAMLVASKAMAENTSDIPSAAMLDFLIEFDDTDEEVFEMVIENGLNDLEQTNLDTDKEKSLSTHSKNDEV